MIIKYIFEQLRHSRLRWSWHISRGSRLQSSGNKRIMNSIRIRVHEQTFVKYKMSTVSSTGTTSSNSNTPARASIAYGVQQKRNVAWRIKILKSFKHFWQWTLKSTCYHFKTLLIPFNWAASNLFIRDIFNNLRLVSHNMLWNCNSLFV